MNWFTGILTYVVIWWLTLFAVLPFGHRDQINPEPGTTESAPEHHRMWLKALITTLIAAVLWAGLWLMIEYDPFGLSAFIRGR